MRAMCLLMTVACVGSSSVAIALQISPVVRRKNVGADGPPPDTRPSSWSALADAAFSSSASRVMAKRRRSMSQSLICRAWESGGATAFSGLDWVEPGDGSVRGARAGATT
jgi:hypothetical protein